MRKKAFQLLICAIILLRILSIMKQALFYAKKPKQVYYHLLRLGTPDWIRTGGLQSRSLTLYPTELRARVRFIV